MSRHNIAILARLCFFLILIYTPNVTWINVCKSDQNKNRVPVVYDIRACRACSKLSIQTIWAGKSLRQWTNWSQSHIGESCITLVRHLQMWRFLCFFIQSYYLSASIFADPVVVGDWMAILRWHHLFIHEIHRDPHPYVILPSQSQTHGFHEGRYRGHVHHTQMRRQQHLPCLWCGITGYHREQTWAQASLKAGSSPWLYSCFETSATKRYQHEEA